MRYISSIDLSGKSIDNPRDLSRCTELKHADLRKTGISAEDYEYLKGTLPDCEILWDVPVMGEYFPEDTKEIKLSSVSEKDIEALSYLHELQFIDGKDCEDLSVLREIKAKYPNASLSFYIPLGDKKYESSDISFFTGDTDIDELIEKADLFSSLSEIHFDVALPSSEKLAELREVLPDVCFFIDRDNKAYGIDISAESLDLFGLSLDSETADTLISYYPKLNEIRINGCSLGDEEIRSLAKKYPDIFFIWNTSLGGISTPTDATELDLSLCEEISLNDIEKALPLFKNLETVRLPSFPGEDERIFALADTYRGVFFIWDIDICGKIVSTELEEIDISGVRPGSTAKIEAYIPYLKNAKKIIMCSCGISNEEMDELNLRYEDIQFVWEVWIGNVTLRTDAIYFAPFKYPTHVDSYSLINLKYCRDLICIDIGHQEVTTCEWAAYMPNLQYLIIADTMISDITPLTGLTNLVFLEMFMTRVRDYTPLTTLTGLEDLNLCYTHGDPSPIEEMTWLKRLWWAGDYTAEAYLKDKLPDTEKEFHSGSSTGGTWRDGQLYKNQRDILGAAYFKG
ncbi:MAG: hypothetical protein MJ067_00390 [Oscillospiraceae bacterium]|nr:hypothetical protein [Oscillospiraceae bacterium]